MKPDRSIPSLDGLRAFSVLFVVLGHTYSSFLVSRTYLNPVRQGELGVSIFFVISGFLITHLLLRERREAGRIDLKHFYARRTIRIFPPFYVYLAVVGVLTVFHLYSATPEAFLSAATYTWNLNTHSGTWILGHTWSLAMEEQFYLFWPACIALLSLRTSLRVGAALVCVTPVFRVIAYFLLPAYRDKLALQLPLRVDVFMVGCIIALIFELKLYTRILDRLTSELALIVALSYLFAIHPFVAGRFHGAFELPVGFTLQAASIGVVLIYSVRKPDSMLGSVLNWKPIRHLGAISYSIYLWQQVFTGPGAIPFPANIPAILLVAEASYWLVERPSQKLRRFFQPAPNARRPRELSEDVVYDVARNVGEPEVAAAVSIS